MRRSALIVVLVVMSLSVYARDRVSRMPPTWGFPRCDSGPSDWYSIKNATLSRSPQDVAVSDVVNLVFAIVGDSVYEANDAGCDWKLRGKVGDSARVVAAPGGVAYAFTETTMVRVTRDRVITATVPDRIMTLAADDTRVVALAYSGAFYESADEGATWQRRGTITKSPLQAAAIDPLDLSHALASTANELWETHDGGRTWASSSPAEDVVAIAFGTDETWTASRSTIYRNGISVLRSAPLVAFSSSMMLAPHPTEPMTVAFPTLNGLAIWSPQTTRVSMMPTPRTLVWSPMGKLLYTTSGQVPTY